LLAYRHSFHAGNHADVLKHIVQVAVLQYFNQKDKPYWVIDTHAGAGLYDLTSKHAQTKGEYLRGIAKVFEQPNLHELIQDYVDVVRQINVEPRQSLRSSANEPANDLPAPSLLTRYPGSPAITRALIRSVDRQRLFELHPTDFELLHNAFAKHRSTTVSKTNGFAGLKAMLPPPPRRAIVLIDPPYEIKDDYTQVVTSLQDSLTRFAQGTYVIWYPRLNRPEPARMIERLKRLPVKWLHVSLDVAEPVADGLGMVGSGLFVINPPWTLHNQLQAALPQLQNLLAQTSRASFLVEQFEPKLS
jgi:23S rRNA (adenine2030-N6)-methyltransferase